MKFTTLLIGLLITHFAFAGLTANEIMKANNQQIKVADETVVIDMTLINKRGKERKRVITLSTQTNSKDEQNSLIKFNSPKNISGTGLLTLEHTDADDDQWLYLPALKRSRRISSANQTDAFMGTDFTYEDLSTEDLSAFKYTLMGEEDLDNQSSYLIKAEPINEEEAQDSGYNYRLLWVRKSDFIVSQIKYFDKQGKLSKILTAKDIKPIPNTPVSRARLVVMKNLNTQHSTELKYKNFEINQGKTDNEFTMRSLERSW